MSLTQNSWNSAAKANAVHVSIHVSTLEHLGNVGEFSFTVTSNNIVRNKKCTPSNNKYKKFKYKKCKQNKISQLNPKSRGNLSKADQNKSKFKIQRQEKGKKGLEET